MYCVDAPLLRYDLNIMCIWLQSGKKAQMGKS